MRTNAGRITLTQIKLKQWHDCSPNVVVWIRRELLPNQSWIICRSTGMFDETEADWLHPFPLHCKKKKKKEKQLLPSCGRANKIKESCGLSLANNKDRQKIEIRRGFTTKTWEKNMHFDVDLHSTSRAREDSCWRPVPARLAFLCHTNFLSDDTS